MKKFLLSVLLLFIFIPVMVNAETCDQSSIKIESIILKNTVGNAEEVSIASTNGKKINLDLNLQEVGDSLEYELKVKNTSNEDYYLDGNSLNIKTDYIKYVFDNGVSSTVIKAKEEKTVQLKITYNKEVPKSKLENGIFNDTNSISLKLSNKEIPFINPKTGTNIFLLLLALMLIGFLLVKLKKEDATNYLIIILGIVFLLPTTVYAICKAEIKIESNVTIENSPFITIASADGLGVMSCDIDYNKCVEKFSSEGMDAESLCRGENINYYGQTINLKQVVSYGASEYEKEGVIKNIKYGKPISHEINHDGCKNYLINNGETDEEQMELFCTGNNATVFGREQNLNEMLDSEPDYAPVYEALGLINVVYQEVKPDRIIIGYDGNIPKDLVIPSTIKGAKIISIAENSFENKQIEKISIPSSVTNIGRKAFNNNSLEKVTIENSSTEIGFCAFGEKESITNNNLPNDYYCETIYWALQDKNNDSINETLVISDNEVFGNMSGNIDGDTYYSDTWSVPWIRISGLSQLSSSYSSNVSDIRIEGTPKPKLTRYWFSGVGYNVSTLNVDLENLDTSQVTDMSFMFYSAGHNASTFNLNLSGWDTSKVTSFSCMFEFAGFNSRTFNLNLSNWDTSKVVYMNNMFWKTGNSTATFSIEGLNSWDTSKVENMYQMFMCAGEYATTFNLDLSNWDTSKVTRMDDMFGGAGRRATTFTLTIPRTNSNGINNTTDKMYGKSTDIYTESPADINNNRRQFTLATN